LGLIWWEETQSGECVLNLRGVWFDGRCQIADESNGKQRSRASHTGCRLRQR